MTNGAITDLTTATPAEIDAEWAPLAAREGRASAEKYTLRHAVAQSQRLLDGLAAGTHRASSWGKADAERVVEAAPAKIAKLNKVIDEAVVEQHPFKVEWARRGGWTRAYLVVTNGQGHVHRTTSCSTCYVTTQFSWLTELSGANEQEIVDAAGERACTVCYASAPVELRLDRKTTLFSEDEKRRQAERAERAAKAAKAAAETIVVFDYYDHSSYARTHTFKTVRGATNAIAGNLSSLTWYGVTHPSAPQWISDIAAVRAALAAKGVEYDYDKALANARKKTNRENSGGSKY